MKAARALVSILAISCLAAGCGSGEETGYVPLTDRPTSVVPAPDYVSFDR
jgi:hypothetical protein